MITPIVSSFLGTLAFSILFNVDRKYYFLCGLTGMIGWVMYCVTVDQTSPAVASFIGTVMVVLIARMFSVWKKCPITLFLIPGIFPLVPGTGVYYTAYYFVVNDMAKASEMGILSVKIAFAIVLGIIFIVSMPRKWFSILYWKKKIEK